MDLHSRYSGHCKKWRMIKIILDVSGAELDINIQIISLLEYV